MNNENHATCATTVGKLAIIGAACRLPGSNSLETFSQLLFSGTCAVTEIPEQRWDKARFYDPRPGQPGKTYTFAAGCLSDVAGFDPAFFGMSPREAMHVDPQQRLLLELVQEALEDAGVSATGLGEKGAGVYVGGSSFDYSVRAAGDVAFSDAYTMQGSALSSMSNRISYVYDLHGPSLTVDTACSSAMVALHLASAALARGEIGMAIVGGVNMLLTPQPFVGFARATMLSKIGRCHAFDARADGYVRSEGGGALILVPLDTAIAMGAEIHAVISATGMNSDGRTNGFSLPNGAAQASLLRRIYNDSGVSPDALGYFEAHGTGTPVGDPIEADAIGHALGRARTNKLLVGSVKPNVGHLEAASGMASLMKALVILREGRIPRSIYNETPNPRIPFDELNIELLQAPRALAQGGLIGVNSFGFGGTNAHALLSPPPAAPKAVSEAAKSLPPLLLSAHSAASLRALADAWASVVVDTSPTTLPARLRGAARGRDHGLYRGVICAEAPSDLLSKLNSLATDELVPGIVTGEAAQGRLAFVYSGNGSQWAGMAQDALRLSPDFRAALSKVDAALAPRLGWSVAERLGEHDALQIRDTSFAQPLLFAVQASLTLALRSLGIVPDAVAGHSVGEVAAALAAGALTLDQAAWVIAARSHHQQATHGFGHMAAFGLGELEAAVAISGIDPRLEIAAVNSPSAVTIAGPDNAIANLVAWSAPRNILCMKLDLDYAFHSRAMDPVEQPLIKTLTGLSPTAPNLTLISSVTGEEMNDAGLTAEYWWRNVRQPVKFSRAMARLVEKGVRVIAEIGPQPVLQPYLRDVLHAAGVTGQHFGSLSRKRLTVDPVMELAARCHVAGASIAATVLYDGPRLLRGLPSTQWQRQDYWHIPTTEAVPIIAPTRDHPLLGYREGNAAGRWHAHMSADLHPWLADHVVGGNVVMPAAAMIDMALAATAALHPDASALEIQNLEISQFLPLAAGTTRDCRFETQQDGRFQLTSRLRLDEAQAVPHASGRLLAGTQSTRLTPPSRLPNPMTGGRVIEADVIYESARRRQLEYGPAFRTVRQVVSFGDDTAHVALEAHNELPPEEGWLLHPAVLDGALHALIAFAADDDGALAEGSVLVPWRFGRIVLSRAVGGMPASGLLSIRKRGPRSLCADIALFDASGAALAELSDCWFVRLPQARQERSVTLFHTALRPADTQPVGQAIAAAELIPHKQLMTDDDSIALMDAFFAASMVEALAEQGELPAGAVANPTVRNTLAWLESDGLAACVDGQWQVLPDHDLPSADLLWRTVFYEAPAAAAELVAASTLASRLGAQLRLQTDEASTALSAPLQEQMLTVSETATVAGAAILEAIEAFLVRWPTGLALRVAVTGYSGVDLAAALVDRLSIAAAHLRVEFRLATDEASAALQHAFADSGEVAVVSGRRAPSGQFDLVIGLWAMSGPAPCTAASLSGLLAPNGVLIAAEAASSRFISLLRQSATWAPEGVAADAAAAELLACGLDIAGPHPIGGEIWAAALITASALHSAAQIAAPARPCMILSGGDTEWDEALQRVLPSASCRPWLLSEAELDIDVISSDVVLLVPEMGEYHQLADVLPGFMAKLVTLALAIDRLADARLFLVVRDNPDGGVLAATIPAIRRVFTNETTNLDCRSIVVDRSLILTSAANAVARELVTVENEPDIALTQAGRLVRRLRVGTPMKHGRAAMLDDDRRLNISRPGLLASLTWERFAPPALAADEVRIDVQAAGLNFRDVMWALGQLPDEALLDGLSGPCLGLECAGVVREVGAGVTDLRPGARVIAVAPSALASSVVTRRRAVLPVPDALDLTAAATIPVAFMTAVYALGHIARLRPGERVLIHGGAGGVGLAAIQYALHRGAIVYATAGDAARRQLLTRLGATKVFDSRSASFFDEVLAASGGVDVVLNSLSGELMRRSLGLLRPFGRFLEIGKRDLYENTSIGLHPLRHNVSYFAIDVDEFAASRPVEAGEVLAEIAELMADGHIRPLPFRRFGYSNAVAAFRQMQASGHIGKIVLTPDGRGRAEEAAQLSLDSNGVFVVTGGLTGFGLQTAQWLVARGARRLALISRRGLATQEAAAALAAFAAAGVTATAYACDVSDKQALGQTLARIRADGAPIRGVLHAAMVIDDALLTEQDEARFAATIAPKLAGAVALDSLTRSDPIDLFILFSSITTAIGNPGQANYVVANAALEAIATRRHAAGLPGLAVCWGPIGDAGHLTDEQRVADMLAKVMGTRHLTAAEALSGLPAALASKAAVIGITHIRWESVRSFLPRLAEPLMSELPMASREEADTGTLRAELATLPPDEAQRRIVEVLKQELATILRLQPSSLRADRELSDLGVDSLMAVEMRLALEARLGIDLPMLSLADRPTLNQVATRVLKLVRSQSEGGCEVSEDQRLDALFLQHEEAEPVSEAAE